MSLPVRLAHGYGIATSALSGTVLDTWFPSPELGKIAPAGPEFSPALLGKDDIREVNREFVQIEIDLDEAPKGVSDA